MLQPRNNTLKIINFSASILLVMVSIWLIVNRQYVYDQITVWQYKPAQGVVNLVDRAGINDNGKFLYLASKPKLDGTQAFNQECDKVENSTSILGCYSDLRIYIYDVKDPQLDGIREVTAAHETLHAAYHRLSDSDKNYVNNLLEQEYKKLEKLPGFEVRMAFYDRTEPNQRDNELHSIIGTEIANISPELETYYKKYFDDRSKVVALNDMYSSVFEALNNKAEILASKANKLSVSITARTDTYNSDVKILNDDIKAFNNKEYTSQYQFYNDRNVLISRISTLDDERSSINDDIVTYNALLKEYNAIATASKKLYNSIDSTLAPPPPSV